MPIWTQSLVYVQDTGRWLTLEMIFSWIFAWHDTSWGLGTRKHHKGQGQGSWESEAKFHCSCLWDTDGQACTCEQVCYYEEVWYHAYQRLVRLSCRNGWPQQAQTMVFPSDALPFFVCFLFSMIPLESKNILYGTVCWHWFLFAVWGGLSLSGTHTLFCDFLSGS